MTTIRTRVAPSPTGDPHVGTAYMALFSMVHAHSQGGQFVLRIEDTDVARSTSASSDNILSSLKWLGIEWDEGPDIGGPFGPYRQSERLDIYARYATQLVEAGHAFPCFCTSERLDAMRREQQLAKETPRYDGHCLSLPPDEIAARVAANDPHVIRMRVPDEGACVIHDELRGDIEIDYTQVDMQVLVKTDGFPTYHLAVVVDDHLMEITDVIRGEEWIPSAPKHLLLSQYLGWEMPRLIHMPLLRNEDHSKLSKRKNATSIRYYERMGFLPEALLNFLGMLGWSMPDQEELFSVAEMQSNFDIRRISTGAPVFDAGKLTWLNGRWLRERMDDEEFADRISNWALNREQLLRVIPLVRERVDLFSQFAPMTTFLLEGLPEIDAEALTVRGQTIDDVKRTLQFALWRTEALSEWTRETLHQLYVDLAADMDLPIRDVLAAVFIAISGKPVSPPLFDSMAILGPDLTRARLRHAVAVAGGVSKKQLKKLEKDYRGLVPNDSEL
jgi:glutamyl-tRNA synthetase